MDAAPSTPSTHANPRPGSEEAEFFDLRLRFRAAHLGLTPLAMAYLEGREQEIAALTARVRALEAALVALAKEVPDA